MVSSLSSRPSACSSLGVPYTEDLYCDDELHPSLENDPNMMLYTENMNTDQHAIDCSDSQRMFDIADDGKDDDACDIMNHVVCFRVHSIHGDTQHRTTIITEHYGQLHLRM